MCGYIPSAGSLESKDMSSVCLYFHVHQPLRIKKYRVFDVGNDHDYFNDISETDLNNEKVFKKVAEKSYIPANNLLLKLLKEHPKFRIYEQHR